MSRITSAACLTMVGILAAHAAEVDVQALFAKAEADGRVGAARKTKPVDARPAKPGEIIVTIIAGEGKETQSPPAAPGDMVVRNRCPETGNEEILVGAAKFAQRYDGPIGEAGKDGWAPYRPTGIEMLYLTLAADEGPFSFTAPWGEPMVARPGDAIVQDPNNPADTYRIAAAAFTCTYEILRPAG
ncbi:MAG: hypothetical protein AB7I59_00305 [Geminicoccaceae bacterium]